MKHKIKKTSFTFLFIFFLTKCIIFAQNLNSDSISPNLKLQGEMGYITKEMGFPFLLLNRLIDTTKQSNEWKTYRSFFRNPNKDNTKEYYVYKWILDKKNGLPYLSLTCYYYLQRGYYVGKTKNREPAFKLYPFKRKIKVSYILQDNKFETIDPKKLKQVKRFMKVSSKRIRL